MSDKAYKNQEQKDAEAVVKEFKEDLGPFVVAVETTRTPMVFTDAKEADNPIIFANDSFLKLTGYDRDEILAQSFNFLLAQGADRDDLDAVAAAFAGKDGDPEIQYRRKDGNEFWATIFVNPVRDEDGKVIQHFVSLVDTTKYKNAQTNAAMLIDELNHRVKNTLATVQSIVAQAARNASGPATARESIETRIAALSRSHDLLGREKWEGAGLRDLVGQALEPFGVPDGRTERFTIEGENIRLSPKATLALGIAFNELATNAIKYGAFSNETGTVSIEWTIEARSDGRWLCLRWREKDGAPVTPPARKGFGSRVIEQGLAHELNGRVDLDYRPDGIVCTIDVPAPRAVLDG
ncbi:MAG: PAS domain-containing protein [Sphingomonadaceae bacterium]|nr:PAS domain-containing protein [Sphingomonadaceae bacterium]